MDSDSKKIIEQRPAAVAGATVQLVPEDEKARPPMTVAGASQPRGGARGLSAGQQERGGALLRCSPPSRGGRWRRSNQPRQNSSAMPRLTAEHNGHMNVLNPPAAA